MLLPKGFFLDSDTLHKYFAILYFAAIMEILPVPLQVFNKAADV